MRLPSHTPPSAIAAHLNQHGWAIAADVLSPSEVIALREDVQTTCPRDGGTSADLAVIERSPALLSLLRNARYLAVMRACIGEKDIVVHRSAALLRPPDTPGIHWHTDFAGGSAAYGANPAVDANSRLNFGEWPNGAWFYLDGCRPERGGLAVMEGSHRAEWTPPSSWSFDLPGVVSIIAEPADLILFSARTWHAAHPLHDIWRHSIGMALRPAQIAVPTPEGTPEATRRFLSGLDVAEAPFFRGYAGWLPAPH